MNGVRPSAKAKAPATIRRQFSSVIGRRSSTAAPTAGATSSPAG
jgi:hypothetical protein